MTTEEATLIYEEACREFFPSGEYRGYRMLGGKIYRRGTDRKLMHSLNAFMVNSPVHPSDGMLVYSRIWGRLSTEAAKMAAVNAGFAMQEKINLAYEHPEQLINLITGKPVMERPAR